MPHACSPRCLFSPDIGSRIDRKSTRLNSSHLVISYAVFCLKKRKAWGTTLTLFSVGGVALLLRERKRARVHSFRLIYGPIFTANDCVFLSLSYFFFLMRGPPRNSPFSPNPPLFQ